MREMDCASNAREIAKQDLVAEQIWGVLVASARDGVTNPNVIAHAAARNVLAALADQRCTAAFSTPYGDRRCDLATGHDGFHIRNDSAGRPEYHWGPPGTGSSDEGRRRARELFEQTRRHPND